MVKIAHIADIHFQDRRRQEYEPILSELYNSLKRDVPDIIAVVGDVFDTKTRATATNIDDVIKFLSELAEIAPVVMIAGNHDMNCLVPNSLDMLTPVVMDNKNLQPPKLFYWRSSGEYFAHGVRWTVISPDGPLVTLSPDSGNTENDAAPRVCMFHEEMYSAHMPNGMLVKDCRITIDYLNNFDAALAGHIHLRQMITKKAGYCGSLVQQNIGEDHNSHGYLVWDVEHGSDPSVQQVNIQNTQGGFIRIMVDKNGNEITEKPLLDNPIYWELVHELETPQLAITTLTADFVNRYRKSPRAIKTASAVLGGVIDGGHQGLATAQESAKSISEHERIIRQILGEDHKYIENIIELHRQKYTSEAVNRPGKLRARLLRLEFSDMYCYGGSNVVDFTKMEGHLSGVIAPNFSGKSSLIDIIVFALFDTHPRAATRGASIRNQANTSKLMLEFELNGKIGRVQKEQDRSKARASKPMYKLWYDGEDITSGGVTETVQEIRRIFGDDKTSLSTSISLQDAGAGSFVMATPAERKKILAELLALGSFSDIEKSVTKELTAANSRVRTLAEQFRGETAEEILAVLEEHRSLLSIAENKIAGLKDDQDRANIEAEAAISIYAVAKSQYDEMAKEVGAIRKQLNLSMEIPDADVLDSIRAKLDQEKSSLDAKLEIAGVDTLDEIRSQIDELGKIDPSTLVLTREIAWPKHVPAWAEVLRTQEAAINAKMTMDSTVSIEGSINELTQLRVRYEIDLSGLKLSGWAAVGAVGGVSNIVGDTNLDLGSRIDALNAAITQRNSNCTRRDDFLSTIPKPEKPEIICNKEYTDLMYIENARVENIWPVERYTTKPPTVAEISAAMAIVGDATPEQIENMKVTIDGIKSVLSRFPDEKITGLSDEDVVTLETCAPSQLNRVCQLVGKPVPEHRWGTGDEPPAPLMEAIMDCKFCDFDVGVPTGATFGVAGAVPEIALATVGDIENAKAILGAVVCGTRAAGVIAHINGLRSEINRLHSGIRDVDISDADMAEYAAMGADDAPSLDVASLNSTLATISTDLIKSRLDMNALVTKIGKIVNQAAIVKTVEAVEAQPSNKLAKSVSTMPTTSPSGSRMGATLCALDDKIEEYRACEYGDQNARDTLVHVADISKR